MTWWVAQNLVVTAVLAGLVWAICKTTRVGPATRHALWLVVLLKLLMPPVLVWPWGVTDLFAVRDPVPVVVSEAVVLAEPVESIEVDLSAFASQATSTEEVAIGNLMETSDEPIETFVDPTEAEVLAPSPIEAAVEPEEIWTARLLRASWTVWIVGAIVFGLLHATRIARMSARLRRGQEPHRDVLEQVVAMSRRLRIKPVETRSVVGVGSPCIWAFLRPRLLWPAELSLKILPSALRGIVVHELAHVKRRDHWVGWLELIAGCVWWWNPLFWYVRHQLRENAELACDAWVVGTLPSGRRAYAEGLLAVCESVSKLSVPLPAVGATASGRQSIERRLNMILRGQSSFRMSRGGLLSALLLAAMALPAWSQRSQFTGSDEPFENVFGISDSTVEGTEVLTLLQEYDQQEAAARKAAQQQANERRQALIEKLQALQDKYARQGKLDEAVAVREQIRRVQGHTPRVIKSTWNPRRATGGLPAHRGRVGETLQFDIVGDRQGRVWGSNPYTDDSSLAAAAVHAGVLQPGQRGIVRVTVLDGAGSYEGSAHNGVKSSSYGPWEGSFRVESSPNAPQPDPGTLSKYRDRVGEAFAFRVVGADSGTVWGTDVYTDDSPLATAAVHAGLLQVGQQGVVYVEILPGQRRYTGSTSHGVTSQDYHSFHGSFRFLPRPTLIGSVKPVEFNVLAPMVTSGTYNGSRGRDDSAAPTKGHSNHGNFKTFVEKQLAIDKQGALKSSAAPDVAYQAIVTNLLDPTQTTDKSAAPSSGLTREQMELLARFIAAQARTASREERKTRSKWFRGEWTAKGFPVTPAVEWLLKQDNIALDAGKYIDDVDSMPDPTVRGPLPKNEPVQWIESAPAKRATPLQRRESLLDEKTAQLNLEAEKSKLDEMTAKWRESNSAAAAGIAGEGTSAQMGMAEAPMPEELKQQQLKVKLAEIELERAQLRLKLRLEERTADE